MADLQGKIGQKGVQIFLRGGTQETPPLVFTRFRLEGGGVSWHEIPWCICKNNGTLVHGVEGPYVRSFWRSSGSTKCAKLFTFLDKSKTDVPSVSWFSWALRGQVWSDYRLIAAKFRNAGGITFANQVEVWNIAQNETYDGRFFGPLFGTFLKKSLDFIFPISGHLRAPVVHDVLVKSKSSHFFQS